MDYEIFPEDQVHAGLLNHALAVAWQSLGSLAVPPPAHCTVEDFFKELAGGLAVLNGTGDTKIVSEVMLHVTYLAEKAGMTTPDILSGDHIVVDEQILFDGLVNIAAVLGTMAKSPAVAVTAADFAPILDTVISGGTLHPDQQITLDALGEVGAALRTAFEIMPSAKPPVMAADFAPILDIAVSRGTFSAEHEAILDSLGEIGAALRSAASRPEPPPPGIPADVFNVILQAETKLTGWCSRDKSLLIASTVLKERPEICVEIGVFGGRSLFPCAAALRHNGSGVIYGIEAWSPNVAIENPTNQVNDEWWSKIDFGRIKHDFFRFTTEMDLSRQVRVVESPSGRAANIVERIDYLHVDGSHSVVNAAEDVLLYVPKVRQGGIVIFDDINWVSTGPARELLASFCEPVTTLKDPETGLDICALLRRR